MKKIITISMLLIACWKMNAQYDMVPPKGLKAPKNYYGYQQYYDTLSIDIDRGEKIKIVYQWYDLFREDEKRFDEYFWQPFESSYTILQEKLEELPLDKKLKYHIQLTTKRSYDDGFFIMNDSVTMQRRTILVERLWKSTNKEDKKAYRDSISLIDKVLHQKMFPLESTLTVTERETRNAQREYKLEGNELIGQAQWQHLLEVSNGFWKVYFYVNDINNLYSINSVDIKEFIRAERQNYIKRGYYRYYTNLRYKLVDGEIKQVRYFRERIRRRERHISLTVNPVLGTSIVKGKWSADLGAMFGVVFNEERNGALRLALRYQLKGLGEETSDETKMKYNGFVDGLFDFNLAKSYKREQWVGLGVGYLLHKEGSIYGDNTARIFLKYRSSQLWGVQPEFNYSFDDNEGFIGLGFFFSL